jgi:hypothetical protein
MLESKKDRAIRIANGLVNSNFPATELAERLTRCQYEAYRGLNIFVENLNEFSTYFVIDGLYKNLLTSDTAEDGAIALWEAKHWVRVYHASEDEDD